MPARPFDSQCLLDQTFLEHVEVRQSLRSTNDRALELCRDETLKLPALIVAEEQTAGRGRQGKSWESAQGSLTFSLICERLAKTSMSELSLQAALAVAMMVDSMLDSTLDSTSSGSAERMVANIKWPNDVYANDRKIAGLLIESPHTQFVPQRVVVGIGVNVHNKCRGAASDETYQAVSLAELGACKVSLQNALIMVLENFNRLGRWSTAKGKPLGALRQMVNERCFLSGKQVVVRSGQAEVGGACEGVDEQGALLLRLTDGTLRRISTGTVVAC